MLDPITLTVIGAFISAGVGGFSFWLKKRGNKKAKHIDDVADLKKAVWRLTKTVLILAKLSDKYTKRAHPDLSLELEEIARELLSANNTLLDEED